MTSNAALLSSSSVIHLYYSYMASFAEGCHPLDLIQTPSSPSPGVQTTIIFIPESSKSHGGKKKQLPATEL